jgi:DNA-binding IclR family transcriptional regulator
VQRSEPLVAEQSKTVDAALSLLRLLAEHDDEPSAAALARALGLSRTAVARMLATLEAHGLARRTHRGWGPGLRLLVLAAGIEPQLRGLARPELEQLAQGFGETAVLTVRDGDEAVAIDQVVGGTGLVQIHYRTGTRHPVQLAASGRALMDDNAPAGVVFSEGELEPGVRGAATPIVDTAGRPIASIGLVAPAHRFPPDDDVAGALRDAGRRISQGLAQLAPPGRTSAAGPEPPPGPTRHSPRPTSRGGSDAVLPTNR